MLYDTLCTPGEKLDLSIETLDSICGDCPLFIMESNAHFGYTNTQGYKEMGIDENTPNPPNGEYHKDSNGKLTGLLI